MGIKERRMRQRETLKDNIIMAAKDLAAQDGWSAVTIRKIAEKIEYSPPIVYEHFENKEELVREIRREGYDKLLSKYQEVLRNPKDPIEMLTTMGAAYWDFAWENPELYKIMYGLEGVSMGTQGLENEIEQIRSIIKDALSAVLKNSKTTIKLKSFNWENAIDILRSLLHGTITFSMIQGLQGDRERARTLAMQGVHDLVTYWIEQ